MAKVELTRKIAASPETVFEALITPEGMASWWGPDDGPVLVAESDPQVGGRYRVRFAMEDGSEHEVRGEFLALDPPRRVVMSFRWVGTEDDIGLSQLEISLRKLDSGTELKLLHTNLPDEESRKDHEQGWSGSLGKLERLFAREGRL